MVFQNPEGRLKEAGFTHMTTRALKSNHTSRSYCERAIFLPVCLRIRISKFRLNDLAHSYKRRVQRFLSKLILSNQLLRVVRVEIKFLRFRFQAGQRPPQILLRHEYVCATPNRRNNWFGGSGKEFVETAHTPCAWKTGTLRST